MNNTDGIPKPDVLIADFDRTLTYLYRDPVLLPELANRIRILYSKAFNLPKNDPETVSDGYFVWHRLHDIAIRELPQASAAEINQKAEDTVADFELEIIKRIGLLPDIPK